MAPGKSWGVRLPSITNKKGMGCLYSGRKGVLEVPGLPEPMGLDHRDHRGLRAEEGQDEGGGGGV